MKRLIYTSSIQPDLQLSDLVQMMERSSRANRKHGLTGLLIFTSRNFAQWIEGEDDAVDALFAKIEKDYRHFHCRKREDVVISQRQWPRWAMNLGLIVDGDIPFVQEDTGQRVNLHTEAQEIELLHRRFFEAVAQLPNLRESLLPKFQEAVAPEPLETSPRKALHQEEAKHLILLGRKLVDLYDQKRAKGVYELVSGSTVWAQTTHQLETMAYRLPQNREAWDGARWEYKPVAHTSTPTGFESCSTTVPFWLYAQAATKLNLPKDYRELPLWLSAFPDLPFRFIKDRQLALMGQLVARPATLKELQTEHPEHGQRLECDLMALVWSGHLKVLPDD
jgi:hypothetical protein